MWAWGQPMVTIDQNVQRLELSVGDATCELTAAEIADAIGALAA